MDTNLKVFFSGLAIVLTFVAYVPYIRSILLGRIKPHVFSWVIWGITTLIIFFAQLEAKGGFGAWPIGVSGIITILIACLAVIKRADITITKVDWAFFLTALASLPFWYFTSDPLWAVVLLTTVDLLGFGPTIRKAYDFPYEESLPFFVLFLFRSIFAIFALQHYSVTTVLFPLCITIVCSAFIAMVMQRRRVLSHEAPV